MIEIAARSISAASRAAFDGFTIAVLADLHYGRLTPLSMVTEAVSVVNRLSPDAVVIPGDIGYLNQYFSVVLMVGNVAPTGSNLVVSELRAELCSECHPFYTVKHKLVDTGGRVERFERRAAKAKTKKA